MPITTFAHRLFEYQGYAFNSVRVMWLPGKTQYQAFGFNRWGEEFNGLSAVADSFDESLESIREKIDSGYRGIIQRRDRLWFPRDFKYEIPAIANYIQVMKENPDHLVFQKQGAGDKYYSYFEHAFILSQIVISVWLKSEYHKELGERGAYVLTSTISAENKQIFTQLESAGFKLKFIDATYL